MHIGDIQELVGASTPGEAVRKVRELVEGFPADRPPDNDREVLTENTAGRCDVGWWDDRRKQWISRGETVRWWELPVSRRNN